MPPPIFGNMGDPKLDSACGGCNHDRFTAQADFTGVGGSQAKENAGEFGAPRPDQAS